MREKSSATSEATDPTRRKPMGGIAMAGDLPAVSGESQANAFGGEAGNKELIDAAIPVPSGAVDLITLQQKKVCLRRMVGTFTT